LSSFLRTLSIKIEKAKEATAIAEQLGNNFITNGTFKICMKQKASLSDYDF